MASEIQVSRGSLYAKGPQNLLRGELFWVPSNNSNDSETAYRKDTNFPYDTGTLYIGRPSLGDSSTYESPIPIAGERAYKGMVFRGYINNEERIEDKLFKFVREGDFFIFGNDAAGGEFKEKGFVKGDILLITKADYSIAPDMKEPGQLDIGQSRGVQYLRLNGSGGESKYTKYSNDEHPNVTTVKMALDELYATKLEYKGTIPGDYTYSGLTTSPKDTLNAGSLFIVTQDGLNFPGKKPDGTQYSKLTRKGDFVFWKNDEDGWVVIPSGYTDSDQIDYDPTIAAQQQENLGTFTEDQREHISSTRSLSNVKDALDYLLSHKAMLDSNGKVPLSQLHSTVLGSMQYMGTWYPITAPEGVNDPNYQNSWPTGRTSEEIDGAEEDSGQGEAANPQNKPGDYYIVKINSSVANVQYYDKTSVPTGNVYSRCLELNNGDWIVYQVDPSNNQASWEVIDNSDKITSLNFVINGKNVTGSPDYAQDKKDVSIVGNPTMAADNKLVLWQDGNKMTFSGVRLVDQDATDQNLKYLDGYLPVYSGNNYTIKRSSIRNYTYGGRAVTETNSNLKVGNDSESYNASIYGDIYLCPKLVLKDGENIAENTGIKFRVVTEQGSSSYNELSLLPNRNSANGAQVFLPSNSSQLIGKLNGVDLIKNRLTKVSATNNESYIDNSSIEEHMHGSISSTTYSDTDIASVEFHAPVLDVNNIETRHITLGEKSNLNTNSDNGGEFEEGRLLGFENKSDLYAHSSQGEPNVTNYLPANSGTLVNNTDLNKVFKGTENTLPMYGHPEPFPGENTPRTTLVDSKVKQVSNALFDSLFNSQSRIKESNRTLDEIKFNGDAYVGKRDEDFVNELYGPKSDPSNMNNVNISADTVIGEISQGLGGTYYISKEKSLMVTKSLILGNKNTASTHIIPGRKCFANSNQYRNSKDEARIPENDVYLELPPISGVLLTDNSRIDGGLYV